LKLFCYLERGPFVPQTYIFFKSELFTVFCIVCIAFRNISHAIKDMSYVYADFYVPLMISFIVYEPIGGKQLTCTY